MTTIRIVPAFERQHDPPVRDRTAEPRRDVTNEA